MVHPAERRSLSPIEGLDKCPWMLCGVPLGLFMVYVTDRRSFVIKGMDRSPRKTTDVRMLCDVILYSQELLGEPMWLILMSEIDCEMYH